MVKELGIFVRKEGRGESVFKLILSVNSGFFYSCFPLDTWQCTKLRIVLLFSMPHTNPVTFLTVSNNYFQGGVSWSENSQGTKILLTHKCFLWMSREKNSPELFLA